MLCNAAIPDLKRTANLGRMITTNRPFCWRERECNNLSTSSFFNVEGGKPRCSRNWRQVPFFGHLQVSAMFPSENQLLQFLWCLKTQVSNNIHGSPGHWLTTTLEAIWRRRSSAVAFDVTHFLHARSWLSNSKQETEGFQSLPVKFLRSTQPTS